MSTRKIKILYTIPNFDTAGSGKHMLDLIMHLDLKQFEPHIACRHDKGIFFQEVKKSGIPVHLFDTAPLLAKNLIFFLNLWENFIFFRRYRFQLIHSFQWSSDLYEPLGARFAGIPFVYTKKNMSWGKNWKRKTYLASHVFALNSEMKIKFLLPSKKTQILGLGVNSKNLVAKVKSWEKKEVRSLLGISNSSIVISSVANLVPLKGIDYLLYAASQIIKENKRDIFLLIVGADDTEYGKELKQLTNKLNINSHVYFTGRVLEVDKYLSITDLYIQPSSEKRGSEALPIATMEAALVGIPVLGSDAAGIKTLLGPFEDHLFHSDNIQSLRGKLLEFIDMPPKELQQKSQALTNYIKSQYDIQMIADEHMRVYKKLVK